MNIGSSESNPGPQAQTALDWLDIDAFLDDYANDIANSDILDDINLDFSLPFPPAPAAPVQVPQAPIVSLPSLPAAAPGAGTEVEMRYGEPALSDSDHASDLEEPKTRTPRGRGGTTKGTAAATKSSGPRFVSKAATEKRKHTTVREKNRRAQQRFRERQKNRVAELEEQVAELTSQLAKVTQERDELAVCHPERAANALPAGNAATTKQQEQQQFRERYGGTHVGVGHPASDVCLDVPIPVSPNGEGITLTFKTDAPPITLTPTDVLVLPASTLSSYMCTCVKELAKTVVDGGDVQTTEQRVNSLVDQAITLWGVVGRANPTTFRHFLTAKLDATQTGRPADERTDHIVRVLALTERQKDDLSALRRLFLQRMSAISAGRSAAAAHTLVGTSPPSCSTSGRAMAAHQLAIRQDCTTVTSTIHEEYVTSLEFEHAVTRHVLSPVQVAQLFIQSYPWPPDCLAVASWAAAEKGDAEALDALNAHTQAQARGGEVTNTPPLAAGTSAGIPTRSRRASAPSPFLL